MVDEEYSDDDSDDETNEKEKCKKKRTDEEDDDDQWPVKKRANAQNQNQSSNPILKPFSGSSSSATQRNVNSQYALELKENIHSLLMWDAMRHGCLQLTEANINRMKVFS